MCWATSSLHHLVAQVGDRLAHIVVAHDVDALLEDDLALIVHHVVVLEHVLARVEVARLDLLLRLLQRLVDPGMRDGLAFLQAELLQHAVHAVGAEDAHQIVFERQIELGAARIALAAGAAAQLVVDAPALVPLGAEHVEAAGVQRLASSSRRRRLLDLPRASRDCICFRVRLRAVDAARLVRSSPAAR